MKCDKSDKSEGFKKDIFCGSIKDCGLNFEWLPYLTIFNIVNMGFRFSKRINIGHGAGVNVSKSGLSGSLRGKYGSFGTTGFSIRTGLPGLSFRKSWASGFRANGIGALLMTVLVGIFAYVLYNILLFIALMVYNVAALLYDTVRYIVRRARINALERKLKRHISEQAANRGFYKFDLSKHPTVAEKVPIFLKEVNIKSGAPIVEGDLVFTLAILDEISPVYAKQPGIITWYKLPGQRLFDGDYLASIELT